MSSGSSKEAYMVIGGSGFLGRHIVESLLARGDIVSVFDIVQRYHDVPFYSGDISEEDQVIHALKTSGTTCIIHTASPAAGLVDPALYWKVNVDGTKAVIAAAQACGVQKLVYTSSAGVVFNGEDLVDVDERLPYPEVPMDAYNESKAKGEEAVLEANGQKGLLTVAIRPAGIFGPGDRQVMAGFTEVYRNGQTHFQIGDNNNLFDWTYVGNVAHAHLLAADKLSQPPPYNKPDAYSTPLPQITVTTGYNRIPTSECRPLGPYVQPPENAKQIEANWENPDWKPTDERPPMRRNKFDQFSDNNLASTPELMNGQVAGQVFFVTNGEPICFWNFGRAIWTRLDKIYGKEQLKKRRIVFSKTFGLLLASAAEGWGWLVGKQPTFSRFRVTFTCASRWYNIEKSRRLLGYEPQVGMEEGIDKMVEWYVAQENKS